MRLTAVVYGIDLYLTTSIGCIADQRATMKLQCLDVTRVCWMIWSFVVLGLGAPFPDKVGCYRVLWAWCEDVTTLDSIPLGDSQILEQHITHVLVRIETSNRYQAMRPYSSSFGLNVKVFSALCWERKSAIHMFSKFFPHCIVHSQWWESCSTP